MTSNERVTMNDELKMMWKKVNPDYFMVLSQ